MNEKLKKILTVFAVVLFIAVAAVWMLTSDVKHIEDVNGAENYSLQTITDQNIINRDVGALGMSKTESALTNVTTYSSDKFTGVEEIFGENIWGNRFEITVNHARVDSGNFRIVLLEDDTIVHEFKLNELTQTYVLENPSGYISLRIAGESADFKLDYSVL